MSESHELFVTDEDPVSGLTAVFEDDGKVAYAYIVQDGKIVGDVWLYNHASTPDEPEWGDWNRAPFLNPKKFAVDERIEPADSPEQVSFAWRQGEPERSVIVSVRGRVLGRLAPGQRPGYATLAKLDGPLARVLMRDA